MTQNTSVGYIPASQTSKTTSILIYDGTPTESDLTTYDEIYTTPALCFAALPAIINHAVTITMRKASGSAYAAATLQRVVAGGSITIQGEYYYNNTVASAGSGTGKFNVIAGHSGLVQTGDKVLMIKYSGTVGGSTPSDAFVDTVASVSGTEITLTTRTTDAFDTSWRYVIVRTELAGLTVTLTDNVTVKGVFSNTTSGTPLVLNFTDNAHLDTLILQSTTSRCLTLTDPKWNAANITGWQYIGFVNTSSSANYGCVRLTSDTNIYGQNWVCLNAGGYANTYGGTINGAPNWLELNYYYIKTTGTGCSYGVLCMGGKMSLGSCYIDGESSSYKMPVALYADRGGFIRASSLTFGSNITTQKSPANWAATTDGSYIS